MSKRKKEDRWQFHDGGRKDAGFKGKAGDCFVRAVAIASEREYGDVYRAVGAAAKKEKPSKRRRGMSAPRTGVHSVTARSFMAEMGWTWVPTMTIGSGCKTHLRHDELPKGRIIARLSRHYVAVVDGVVLDTYDCTREGTRCVYGYWKEASDE